MKNQIEMQKEILMIQSEIREMEKNLKNSKNYLKYLKECFEDEKEEEEIETPQQRECQILFNKWIQGKL